MSSSELDRRLAGRLDCRIPVRLSAGNRVLHTETENLSRVGVLLRVPVSELGLVAPAPLGSVAEELSRVLGDIATAEFRYDVLGALVCRTLRLVRIGRSDPDGEWVEIGCALRRPLTDDEAHVLNLPLPPLRWHPVREQDGRDPTEAPGVPTRVISLVLCPEPGRPARPLIGTARELSARGVRACIEDLSALPPRAGRRDVGSLLSVLSEAYGTEPVVLLMCDGRPLWSGSARVEMVELNAGRGAIDLQLVFRRNLNVPELARLGVA